MLNKVFRKGDRVKFAKLWFRNWFADPAAEKAKRGTILHNGHEYMHTVAVRWDGRKSHSYYHKSFIELLPPKEQRHDQAD